MNTASSASKRLTAPASWSFNTRGQSFSIFVSSVSIAALSGVGSAIAMFVLVEVVGCGPAQPNCAKANNAATSDSVTTNRNLFITRLLLAWKESLSCRYHNDFYAKFDGESIAIWPAPGCQTTGPSENVDL